MYELKKFQLPESGLVEFYTSEDKKFDYIDEHNYLPGHRVRNLEISVLFFKEFSINPYYQIKIKSSFI